MEEYFEDILLDVRYERTLLLVYTVFKPEILLEIGFTQTQVNFLQDPNEKKIQRQKLIFDKINEVLWRNDN